MTKFCCNAFLVLHHHCRRILRHFRTICQGFVLNNVCQLRVDDIERKEMAHKYSALFSFFFSDAVCSLLEWQMENKNQYFPETL